MKRSLLLKSVFGALVAATATLAPLTAAHADFQVRNHELGFLNDILDPEPRGAQGPIRSDMSDTYTVRNSELGFLEDIFHPEPRGAQGPMRTDRDEAAERDLQRRLGGFGGVGTH